MAFEKVTRQQAKLRMALTGVSGAGKTLGALYVAYGLAGDWGKVALIDTEHERARFYANRSDLGTGEFLYASMGPPYSPARFQQMVREGAEAVGPDGVVIVDSLSHAWNSEGGVLDMKEQIAQQAGKNSYTAWHEAGKLQNTLINTILAVPCHTIVTLRSKMEYALEINDRGKQQPVKLGLAPVQRDDTEYEFDVVLDVARNHIATASKDTTFLDKFGQVITPALGEQLRDWMKMGVEPVLCEACGGAINAAKGKSVEELCAGTRNTAGQQMCITCFGAWQKRAKARQQEVARILKEIEGDEAQLRGCIECWIQDGILTTGDVSRMDDGDYGALLAELEKLRV